MWLLQLPETALVLVLQKLDLSSCASTALCCSNLSHAVPAQISKIDVRLWTPEKLASFALWLEQHSNCLANVTECSLDHSLVECATAPVRLPCPQLLQLRLCSFKVQFAPSAGCPGVLHACRGLTTLELRNCVVPDARMTACYPGQYLQQLVEVPLQEPLAKPQ
jgi:hypothetical protein